MSLPKIPEGASTLRSLPPGGNLGLQKTPASARTVKPDGQAKNDWSLAAHGNDAGDDVQTTGVSIDSESTSSSGASRTFSKTSAASSNGTAVTGAARMIAAVPTNAPTDAPDDTIAPVTYQTRAPSYSYAGYCAIWSVLAITTGAVFTLKITNTIPTASPDTTELKAAAGAAFLVGLGTASCAVWSAVYNACRSS